MYRGGGHNFRLVGSLVRWPDLSLSSGPSLFLLEACPTCHRVYDACSALVTSGSSHVGPWIHVTTTLANERRESRDPRVEITFGVYGRIMEA